MFNKEPVIPLKRFPPVLKAADEKSKNKISDLNFYDGFHEIYGGSPYSQEFITFLRELHCESFLELSEQLKELYGSMHMLDAMGGGFFIDPDNYDHVDTMTQLRLANIDDEYFDSLEREVSKSDDPLLISQLRQAQLKIRQLQQQQKRDGVYGSVYDTETWDHLTNFMEEKNIPSFDLIICRPMGPFTNLHLSKDAVLSEREMLMYAVLFDNLFKRLLEKTNHHHGMLFLGLPQIFHAKHEWINEWVTKIKKRHNVEIKVDSYCEHIFVQYK